MADVDQVTSTLTLPSAPAISAVSVPARRGAKTTEPRAISWSGFCHDALASSSSAET
ncbi:hypothetical protein TRIUR3_12541 [Triticum urartu]|uniref:Uncharacterized protein n=1 Tax=Triticum urartu TaxID=4572 RepID=M7ZM98_TRIUA|nr:hypothetical protein TRIUR3_12541 [Triticum urartu]